MTKPNNLKPIYWLLFAAGGMIAALVLPALVVILSWLLPFGVIGSADTFYQTVSPLFQNGLFYLVVVAVLFVMLWHTAHRFTMCCTTCTFMWELKRATLCMRLLWCVACGLWWRVGDDLNA